MNTADCQSELSRNGSRGLEGGYFLHAQLLNRTEILTAPGKHAINSFKDFASINAEARFSQFFIASNNIEDTTIDNTPEEIKKSSKEEKVGFFHRLVANSLKDLLPVFKTSSLDSDINQLLYDHPVQSRRQKPSVSSNNRITSSKLDCGRTVSADEAQTFVSTLFISTENMLRSRLENVVFKNKKKVQYRCKNCAKVFKYLNVATAHVKKCLSSTTVNEETSDENEEPEDLFFNYKNAEFFMDAMLVMMSHFEKYGDGLG